MNKLEKYTTIHVEIEPELYHAAEESLQKIGCSVSQFCALCLLRGARYRRDIPAFEDMTSKEIIEKIVSDVVEELLLLYINRPDYDCDNDVHK